MAKLTFLPEDITIDVSPGMNILDAAYDNGIDLPSQCQMGTCTSCMAKVIQGREFISENYGDDFLNESNSETILSCISEIKENSENEHLIIVISE